MSRREASEWLEELRRTRLALPLIAAPMFEVSGPALATAACSHGVIGSLPAHNARDTAELDDWLDEIATATPPLAAPVAPNVLVHRSNRRLDADLDCITRHEVELVIASVGSPAPIVDGLHAAGIHVFADVASLRHVERALEAGVDGLVLLSAGAGGQTGWANPFAFVRAVRERFAGPLVLAGGISDGTALWAAIVAGCDLAYMGTPFIAASESLADDRYRQLAAAATLDDITLTAALTGIPANVLTASIDAETSLTASEGFEQGRLAEGRGRAYGAGHTVGAVAASGPCADLIAKVRRDYATAREHTCGLLASRYE